MSNLHDRLTHRRKTIVTLVLGVFISSSYTIASPQHSPPVELPGQSRAEAARNKIIPNDRGGRPSDDGSSFTGARRGKLDVSLFGRDLVDLPIIEIQFFPEEKSFKFQHKPINNLVGNNGVGQNGGREWYGEMIGGKGGNMILIERGPEHRLTGSVSTDTTVYQVNTEQDGSVEVEAIPMPSFPDEFEPLELPDVSDEGRALRGGGLDFNRAANHDSVSVYIDNTRKLQDNGAVIDVMVAYTYRAMCKQANLAYPCDTTQANQQPILDRIDLAITETNVAYDESGVYTQLRLVHAFLDPDFDDTVDYSTMLSRLRNNNDGYIDQAHTKRDLYGADMVALIAENGQYCGIGYIGPSATSAFTVTARGCMTGYYSFGHELGHNMGCQHDRANAGTSTAYAHGYQDPNNAFRSILAYNCAGGCPRVLRFSNIQYQYNGKDIGQPDSEDNARQINDVRVQVSQFGDTVAACQNNDFCDDGFACNGAETCNLSTGLCEAGVPVSCDDNNLCTIDTCNPSDGSCNYPPRDCDDGNACTADSCNPATGCVHTPLTECCGNGICDGDEDCSTCFSDCCSALETTMAGGNGQAGNMFDIKALNDITVTSFGIHVDTTNQVSVRVYTRMGTFAPYTGSLAGWQEVLSSTPVIGQGLGNRTPIPALNPPVSVSTGSTQAFYITLESTNLDYTTGTTQGNLYASNSDLEFYEGAGVTYPLNNTYAPRIWNGVIYYELTSTSEETPSATPSASPSASPTNSMSPSGAPTVAKPSSPPSASPTTSQVPSSSPLSLPSSSPSFTPTTSQQPSSSPSASPTISQVPSSSPLSSPSSSPSIMPTVSHEPSSPPSVSPTTSQVPSSSPLSSPSSLPSVMPTVSHEPSSPPSASPTTSQVPSSSPLTLPSSLPSVMPTISHEPSLSPSASPTAGLAKVGEPCVEDIDCQSGLCSGGKPDTRVCLSNGQSCTLGQSGDACASGPDCCSGFCKGNGTCK